MRRGNFNLFSLSPVAAKKDPVPGNHGIHSPVPESLRQSGDKLESKGRPHRNGGAPEEGAVIIASPKPQSSPGRAESRSGHDNQPANGGAPGLNPGRFGDPETAGSKLGKRLDQVKDDIPSLHPGKGHRLPSPETRPKEWKDIHLAPDRAIKQDALRVTEGRKPANPGAYPAAFTYPAGGGLNGPSAKHTRPYFPLSFRDVSRIHAWQNFITVSALSVLALASSGCLPILLGGPKTLKPGEMTVSLAGMGRADNMPDQVKRAGSASGVVELRGGLMERLDSAVTLHLPWAASWDMKYQVNAEHRWMPGTAIQLVLGAAQPSFIGMFIAGKSFGPVTATASVSAGRTNERLWRPGGTPFGTQSETLAKEVYSWGGAVEYEASSIHRFFLNAIAWNNVREQEVPIVEGNSFGVNEGVSWFFTAGLRVAWQAPQAVFKRDNSTTVLRGYLFTNPENGSMEIGQAGLFRATVLTDSFTRYTRDGKRVSASELQAGMPVLVQGILMPKPSTFLARSIEIQGDR